MAPNLNRKLDLIRWTANPRRVTGSEVSELIVIVIVLAVWVVAGCLFCSSARPAETGALLDSTPQQALGTMAALAPFLVAGLLILCWLWRERSAALSDGDRDGSPFAAFETRRDPAPGFSPHAAASLVPDEADLRSLEHRARDADGR